MALVSAGQDTQYKRGEWVVYDRFGQVRTGRVESDENGCGVIVDDQDDAVRTIVAHDQLRAESDHEQNMRERLGYHAQDLGSTVQR